MEAKLKDQWLFRAIQTSLDRVQKSDIVNTEKLGAISEPEFIQKVQSVLQNRGTDKAA
jgi:hypothetical protein